MSGRGISGGFRALESFIFCNVSVILVNTEPRLASVVDTEAEDSV